jgi:hypothetical protein
MSLADKLMRYGVDALPHACAVFLFSSFFYFLLFFFLSGVYWELVDKISPAFELRNSDVPAVVSQVIPAAHLNTSTAN